MILNLQHFIAVCVWWWKLWGTDSITYNLRHLEFLGDPTPWLDYEEGSSIVAGVWQDFLLFFVGTRSISYNYSISIYPPKNDNNMMNQKQMPFKWYQFIKMPTKSMPFKLSEKTNDLMNIINIKNRWIIRKTQWFDERIGPCAQGLVQSYCHALTFSVPGDALEEGSRAAAWSFDKIIGLFLNPNKNDENLYGNWDIMKYLVLILFG